MNCSSILVDIGNSAVDICCHMDTGNEYAKISSDDFKALDVFFSNVTIGSTIHLSYVREDTKNHLLALFSKLGLSYTVLTPKVMEDYARENGYRVDNLSYLGQDLFCDIVSEENRSGLIVIDLGTASKILYLDKDGHFHGASILPGIMTFAKSLTENTSYINENSFVEHPPVVSLVTEECISSGALYGTSGAIASIINRIKKDFDAYDSKVVLTGGNARYVKSLLQESGLTEIQEEPNSVLKGLGRIYKIDL